MPVTEPNASETVNALELGHVAHTRRLAKLANQAKAEINGRLSEDSLSATIADAVVPAYGLSAGISRVVGVGTSITQASEVGGAPNRWTDLLPARVLARTGMVITCANAGVAGNTSAQMLTRLPAILATGYDAVVIETSVNDFSLTVGLPLSESVNNMARMIQLTRQAGAIPVVVASAPFDSTTATAWSPIKQARANTAIRALCASLGVVYVDLMEKFKGIAAYTDGLHPSAGGQGNWAEAIAAAITGNPSTAVAVDLLTRNRTGRLGSTDDGRVWVSAAGTWGCEGGVGAFTGAAGNEIALVNVGSPDQEVTVKIGVAIGVGLIIRSSQDGQNAYILTASGKQLYRRSAGVLTLITSFTSPDFVAGDEVTFSVKGNSLKVYRNAVEVYSHTATTILTGDWCGLYHSQANAATRWKNFSATAI